jgi:hypothetical protein
MSTPSEILMLVGKIRIMRAYPCAREFPHELPEVLGVWVVSCICDALSTMVFNLTIYKSNALFIVVYEVTITIIGASRVFCTQFNMSS